jgi:hypothetical protein
MGRMTELNTLLRIPEDVEKQLEVGKRFNIELPRERIFPLHIAILYINKSWQFLGYAVAHSALIENEKTILNTEILSIFSPEESALYTKIFREAALKTGEIK